MTRVSIRPVTTSRDRRQFLKLPWEIYRNDRNWVPPLRLNQKELVNFKPHPFYERAEIQTFLAFQRDRPCGRIAAIHAPDHNRYCPEEPRGFIGFFDSIDDQQVANHLFDAALAWLAERGQKIVRGPMNPSMNYECGLLVENFDMPPTFMMTYNHAYYVQLWENYGFQKAQDLFSFVGNRGHLETLEQKVYFVAGESARRFNIKVRPLDRRHLMKDLRTFLEIYNSALEGNWGHLPMSAAEVTHTAAGLRFLLVPELAIFAEVDGKPIGAMLGLLDFNPRIREIDGRLFPFGFLKLLTGRRKIGRLRLVSTNVLPEYQRWGVGLVLAANMLKPALEYGIATGEFSWVLESNHLSRKTLERSKVPVEKVHRIYDFFDHDSR